MNAILTKNLKKTFAKISLLALVFSLIQVPVVTKTQVALAALTSIQSITATSGGPTLGIVVLTFAASQQNDELPNTPQGITCASANNLPCYSSFGTITLTKGQNTYTPAAVTRADKTTQNPQQSDFLKLSIAFTNPTTIDNTYTISYSFSGDLSSLSSFNANNQAITSGQQQQSSPISNVALADNDTTGFGLDGRDFTVTWTAATQPAGYSGTAIYIVNNINSALSLNNINSNGCGGQQCRQVGFITNFSQASFTLNEGEPEDSERALWDSETTYKACVLISATSSSLTCSSSGTTVTSDDNVTDGGGGLIDHTPLQKVVAGRQAVVHAIFEDDVTQKDDLGTNGSYIKMFYKIDGGQTQEVSGQSVAGTKNLFKFTTATNVSTSFQYYLEARDMGGNITVFSNDPTATSQNATNSMIQPSVDAANVTTYTVTGNVIDLQDSDAVTNTYVYLEGLGIAGDVADGGDDSNMYSITGVPQGNYDLIGEKMTFCGLSENIFVKDGTVTKNLFMDIGDCGFSFDFTQGGTGASSGKAHEVFTRPCEYCSISKDEPILIGFDQNMDGSTIEDLQGDGNVYLTQDGGLTKVTGTVDYCQSKTEDAPCSTLTSGDQFVIVFTPAADLTEGMFYALVAGPNVKSESNQCIEGNSTSTSCGYELYFTVGNMYTADDIADNFGTGGYAPPFIESMQPSPGTFAPASTKILVKFNDAMDSSTINTSTIVLIKGSSTITTTVSLDSNDSKTVTITPASSLAAGDYELQVKGSAASSSGVTMCDPGFGNSDPSTCIAFSSFFNIDTTLTALTPTIYPGISNGATGVKVNEGNFRYGFSEIMDTSTFTNNLSFKRGSTDVAYSTYYDFGTNELFLIPNDVLSTSTTYTLTFSGGSSGVKSLAGGTLSATSQAFTFTTDSSIDTTAPKLIDARCDDYQCELFFNEPMNNQASTGSRYSQSAIKPANWALTYGPNGTENTVDVSSKTFIYTARDFSVRVEGLTLTPGDTFIMTAATAVEDLSQNAVSSSEKSWKGKIEAPGSAECFDCMFSSGGGTDGFEADKNFGGDWGKDDFFSGTATWAFPFNMVAGLDSNVFQTGTTFTSAAQNGDIITIDFPDTTDCSSVEKDTLSPFANNVLDFSQSGATVSFVNPTCDTSTDTVSLTLSVTGTPNANDRYIFDLRKILNPTIPKDWSTSGYTVNLTRKNSSNVVQETYTSMPYFIQEAGDDSITLNIYAGSLDSPDAEADGNVFIWGGGPFGDMSKEITLTNGIVSAVAGTSASSIQYTGLTDGCYFFGTEPLVTLGSDDYFGQNSWEPVCVDSQNTTASKNIVLTKATSASAATLTIKIAGTFTDEDIDIFAGGPGDFVVKTLSGVTTPDTNGYNLRIRNNGHWFIGMGPAYPKSGGNFKPLSCTTPPPIDINVSGVGGTPTFATGFFAPEGYSLSGSTLTITCATADKQVTGKVTDGNGNGISNVEVFMHKQGFGSETFTTTDANGSWKLNVGDYGNWEVGTWKDGLPPIFEQIELKANTSASDGNTTADVYFRGNLITASNQLLLKMKKFDRSISGKVADSNGNAITYAQGFATTANGDFIPIKTDGNGNYSVFVYGSATGVTWTIRADLPPDKTDQCGTLSKTVTITTSDASGQNIQPSTSTCYEISGTITLDGDAQANVPLGVMEWDSTNSAPVVAGAFKHSSTNSSGAYKVKVPGPSGLETSKTYKVSTWSPNYGELSTTTTVTNANKTGIDITKTLGTATFAFTGGTANHEAMIEIKKSTDQDASLSKYVQGLSSNVTLQAEAGTYNYYVSVFGVGDYSGTVATGSTATIDLSAQSLLSLCGTVQDDDGNDLEGALVTVTDVNTGRIRTATTDSDGDYCVKAKAGTKEVAVDLSGYIRQEAPQEVILTADTTGYDFVDGADREPLESTDLSITGTLIKDSGGSSDVFDVEASVWATFVDGDTDESNDIIASGSVNPDGTFEIPVSAGQWIPQVAADLHEQEDFTAVTVSTEDVSTGELELTADATRISTVSSSTMQANVGGTVADANTGIEVTSPAGALDSSGDVTLTITSGHDGIETSNYVPVENAIYDITASGTSTIKELNDFIEIQFPYGDLVASLPTGVSEDELQLVYYSEEKGEYVPVEGGFTIDETNDTITGQVNHFTSFAVVYKQVDTGTSTPPSNPSTPASTPSSVGGGGSSSRTSDTVAVAEEEEVTVEPEDGMVVVEEEEESEAEVKVAESTFTDVVSHWASKYIGKLFEKKVIKGYDDGTFKPNNELNRAELTKMVLNNFEVVVGSGETSFSDVESSAWYSPYIEKAKELGIVEGYKDGTFKPGQSITRAEALKIVLEAAGIAISEEIDLGFDPFSDVKDGDGQWYTKYVLYAYDLGIVEGYKDQTFKPEQNITRAEFAKILVKVSDL